MSDSKPSTPAAAKSSDDGPSTMSLLGGVAIVGAAAGYAALAMRFRKFSETANTAGRMASGSAEMRAAEAFTRDWSRVEKDGAGAAFGNAFKGDQQPGGDEWQGSRRRRARSEDGGWSQAAHEHLQSGTLLNEPPAWALRELGLPSDARSFTLEKAKTAFRERAKLVHPDAPGGDEQAFKRVSAAYEAVQKSST